MTGPPRPISWPYVRTLVHEAELGSTSDLALSLLEDPAVELPLLVRADRQMAGRGRGSNRWWSDTGSLTFTLGLDPATLGLASGHLARVALVAAVVLIDTLERWVPAGLLGIRWPNDVEAGGRKLAGMLPEHRLTGRGPRLALGVGLNVRSQLDQAPDELRRLATSVERLAAGPVSADVILADFLRGIGPALEALGRDDPGLAQRWGELDQLAGQVVRIRMPDRLIEGRATGIDDRGALRVATAEGEQVLLGGQVLRDAV